MVRLTARPPARSTSSPFYRYRVVTHAVARYTFAFSVRFLNSRVYWEENIYFHHTSLHTYQLSCTRIPFPSPSRVCPSFHPSSSTAVFSPHVRSRFCFFLFSPRSPVFHPRYPHTYDRARLLRVSLCDRGRIDPCIPPHLVHTAHPFRALPARVLNAHQAAVTVFLVGSIPKGSRSRTRTPVQNNTPHNQDLESWLL